MNKFYILKLYTLCNTYTNYIFKIKTSQCYFYLTFNLLTCFRNEQKRGPFNEVLSTFSLDTERLLTAQEYKDVKLQLTFLKTEVKDTTILFISSLYCKSVLPGQGGLNRIVSKSTQTSSLRREMSLMKTKH